MTVGFRVIEGGVSPHEPAPIVWNREPVGIARVALVIRDNPDPYEPIALAWDDGRQFLVGIRCIRLPADAAALATWVATARADGLEVRDERAGNPLLAGSTSLRFDIARHDRERMLKRRADPLPEGSLFDEVTRAQTDLF